jgi:hypothetical protein
MPLPWMSILDAVIGVTDLALSRRGGRKPEAEDDGAVALGDAGAREMGRLDTRLVGVVVAALQEVFDRDSRRLDLDREQAEAERQRSERALRLELLRQAADRELGRLRLVVGVAIVSCLATLFLSGRLVGEHVASRVAVGGGWAFLLAALAISFVGQSRISAAVSRADRIQDEVLPAGAGTLAAACIIVGLACIGIAMLIA